MRQVRVIQLVKEGIKMSDKLNMSGGGVLEVLIFYECGQC